MVKIKEIKEKQGDISKTDASASLHGVKKKKMKNKGKQLQGEIGSNAGKKPSKSVMRRLRKKLLKQYKNPQVGTNTSKKNLKKKPAKGSPPTSQNEIDEPKQTDGPQYKAFIGGLPKRANSNSIRSTLEAAGVEPEAVKVAHGNGKTCAIVKFGSEKSLSDALLLSKKLEFNGKPLTISKFKEKKQGTDKSSNKEGKEGTEESGSPEGEVSDDGTEENEELETETTDMKKVPSVQIKPKFKKGEKENEINQDSSKSDELIDSKNKKKRRKHKRKALQDDISSKNSESTTNPVERKKFKSFPPSGKKNKLQSKKPKGT